MYGKKWFNFGIALLVFLGIYLAIDGFINSYPRELLQSERPEMINIEASEPVMLNGSYIFFEPKGLKVDFWRGKDDAGHLSVQLPGDNSSFKRIIVFSKINKIIVQQGKSGAHLALDG